MAQPHAVEVLLRPAVELYTVAVCTGAAILCLVAPWSLALNPLLGLGSALALGLTFVGYAFALWRRYSDELARKTFRLSIIHLMLLFAALLVDHYWTI